MHCQFTSTQEQITITTTVNGLGWIEALPPENEVYFCQRPTLEFWKILTRSIDTALKNNFLKDPGDELGIVIKLMEDRAAGPFVMPKFFNPYSDGVSAGWSRLTAEVFCGIERQDINGMVITNNPTLLVKKFEEFQKISTTAEFESRVFPTKPNYSIIWEQHSNNTVHVLRTLTDDSLYNASFVTQTFKHHNDNRLTFLKRYIHDQKIHIKICCTEQTAKLIEYDSKLFEVVFDFQDPKEWEFSYGVLLGKYRYLGEQKPDPSLNLWVYSILQPFSLTKLLMWTTIEHGAYYTKNRKIILFDPDLNTTIKEIPDIVK
jgi:hypothetical protein